MARGVVMLAGDFGDPSSAVTANRLSAAHDRLVHDPAFQFSFDRPPGPPTIPLWLRWIGQLLNLILPYTSWLLWGGLIVGVLVVIALVGRELLPKRGANSAARTRTSLTLTDWRPDAGRARTLLSDADKLAQAGRFTEAARVLLHRSIEDIEHHRPALVAVAYTSRDIAALDHLPNPARQAFGRIALHVEHSLFGDRPMDAETFGDCRAAYTDFAFPEAWDR